MELEKASNVMFTGKCPKNYLNFIEMMIDRNILKYVNVTTLCHEEPIFKKKNLYLSLK